MNKHYGYDGLRGITEEGSSEELEGLIKHKIAGFLNDASLDQPLHESQEYSMEGNRFDHPIFTASSNLRV